MKISSIFKTGLLKAAVASALALPLAVSCFDPSGLQEQIDMLVDKVFELETKLNNEIAALQAMLKGNVLISKVVTDASTGITTVTLTDGTQLQLLPEKDMKSYITYLTLGDGKAYWAYIAEDGTKQLFKDEKNQPIPVIAETPKVVEVDGETYLEIGGTRYPLSGNSVFSDYEVITDELTGEVYAVTFTFGDDMTFTVTVDGACGFHFVKPAGWDTVIISDYYVANGLTERVQVDARGVVDFVLQIPDGWRVKEYKDIYMGGMYFDITAPAKELVDAGVAAADGDLKVVAVLEGGKATVARLYLTTTPFRTFGFSLGTVNAQMYNGLQKFVYGVCTKAAFDKAAIFETASGLLEAYDYPAGYGLADFDLSATVEEVLGEEPMAGEEYVFWALPALYYETMEGAGYYLSEETFVTTEFKYSSVVFEVSNEQFRDADLNMQLRGVDAYYVDLIPASEYMLEDVVFGLNNGFYEPVSDSMVYNGSIFDFFGTEAESGTSYVAWIAVAEEGKQYTEADIVVCEFSTLNLTPGGNVKVTAADPVCTTLDAVVSLTAPGAETLYYSFMTAADAKRYADDAAKAMYLFENGNSVKETSVEAKLSESGIKAKPKTDYVLFAVASDADGKYGDVLTVECSTTDIVYNDLQVKIDITKNEPGDVRISIAADGAVDFLYWIGRTNDNTWKSSNYLGGSAEKAQAFMYVNAEHSRLTSVMTKYPVVDGVITLADLEGGKDYVMVAMAKSADGSYSKATEFRFAPRAVSIGDVVLSSDPKWEAAKPTIEWIPERFTQSSGGVLPGTYGYMITIPEGFTAYVLSATYSYFNNGDDTLVLTPEEYIVSLMQQADKPRDWHLTISEDWEWPHIGYEHYHSHHGAELWGNSVIWASQEFHDSKCNCGGNFVEEKEMQGHMVTVTHKININDGNPIEFRMPQAIASLQEVIDRVFVVCQDLEGNCYEMFVFDVPVDLFVNAGGRG